MLICIGSFIESQTINLNLKKMKKSLLTLMVGLLISASTMAQSKSEKKIEKRANAAVEKVQATVKLSEEEKVKYFEIQKTQLINRAEVPKGLKQSDPDKFKEKVKESRKQFTKNLMDAFGKKRGKEILEASKKK